LYWIQAHYSIKFYRVRFVLETVPDLLRVRLVVAHLVGRIVITVRLTETVIVVDRLLEVVIVYVTLFVRVGQKVTSVRVCVILVVTDLLPDLNDDTVATLDVA